MPTRACAVGMDQYEMFDEGGGEEEADLITPPSTENRPSLQEDERLNYQQYRRPAASKARILSRSPLFRAQVLRNARPVRIVCAELAFVCITLSAIVRHTH